MNRVVSSSIVSVVILLLITGGFFYYQYYRGTNASAYETVPADVAWLVSCDPSSGELRQLAKTGFFNGHDTIQVLNEWYHALMGFDSLVVNTPELKSVFADNPLLISGHVTGPGNFSLVFISKLAGRNPDAVAQLLTRRLLNFSADVPTRNYNGVDIREMVTGKDNHTFSWAVSKGVFIGSFTAYLVEDAIRQQRSGKILSPATRLQSFAEAKGSGLLAAIKYSGFQRWVSTQLDPASNITLAPLRRVGDWTIVRLELHPNLITFNGITTLNDSLEFVELFRNQKPVKSKIISMLPTRTAATIIWGISEPRQFLDDLGLYLRKQEGNPAETAGDRASMIKYFRNWLGEEVGLMVMKPVSTGIDNNYFGILAVSDETLCKSSLLAFAKNLGGKNGDASAEEAYNGYSIRYIPLQGILPSLFGPLFNRVNNFYYTIIEGHLVIANQASSLRGFINDIKTKNLLSGDDRYIAMASDIPAESNLFFYCSIPQSEAIFRSVAVPQWVNWLSKYGESLKGWNGLAFSISNQQGVYNSHGCLSYFNNGAKGPHLVWNAKLDTSIINGPFIPGGGIGLTLIQDAQLQLCAIDPDGNIKWKKKLDSQIKGNIYPVNYYGKGLNEFVFNTGSFIYMLDSSGANVGNFPIRLPAASSNGIAVILPDSLHTDARMYIACTNLRAYGYEITGKPLSGFNTIKLPDVVFEPVRFIVNGDHQYLMITDKQGTCFFTDRTGNRLFTLKEKLSVMEGADIFPAIDSLQLFRWVDPSGMVYHAGLSGEVVEDFKLDGDSITGVIQSDVNGDGDPDWIITGKNGLQVETSEKIVLYRFRTAEPAYSPAVFTQAGKSYFVFSSPEAGKFYLINRDGTLYEGFPQPGIDTPSYFINNNMTGIPLIVKGDERSINFYQVD